jgi:hypothetical protein
MDGIHFVVRCILDACNVGSESCCDVNDPVGSSYFQDWDGMMLELKGVGDPLAACVSHDGSNVTIVICGMQ